MTKRSKRSKRRAPLLPTRSPMPSAVLDQAPPPLTQELRPQYAVESEDEFAERRRAFGRKAGAKKRHEDAQLPDAVVAKIAEYCRDHPAASNNEIARWLKATPATKPLVAHLKLATLAKKVGRVRPPRKKAGTI